ncbi:MAG: hypothetical protein CVV42_01915 [Candidatus Riflebacteria bacterium HGW-Riflebacteria-2]|jgi:flagellar biosynthesis protein FlhF|nr:MAG: hypothetical protein CVV42_01915 [Candidatus Riflebacteria bacterium HGW-Riflebacteria-2]
MSYQQYEKLLGETFFEANLKAENKYGKGNFEVLTSKRVKHPIYLGLGTKELVELTIGILDRKPAIRSLPDAPSRPLPSVEITAPRQAAVSSFPSSDKGQKLSLKAEMPATQAKHNSQTAAEERALAYTPGIKAYAAQKLSHNTREVHGLRTIQEGDCDPRPQSINDPGLEPHQIQDLLTEIMAVKDERQRRERMLPRADEKKQARVAQPELKPDKSPDDMKVMVSAMEERVNQIFAMLQNLNRESGEVLERQIVELPKGLFELKKNLLAMETPLEIADQVIFDLKDNLPTSALRYPAEALRAACSWFEKKLKFSPEIEFKRKNGPTVVVFIGPTGVGKTTTIAKLAAAYGICPREQKSIALFTLDTYRIGAVNHLQQFAEIIGAEMEILYKPDEINPALERHQDKDLIIVDTAGRCQKDTDEICELSGFIEKLPSASKYLVLSATSKYTDMIDTIRCFGRVGFDHLIFTKIDETNTIGPLLALLFKTGKSLAYITNGQKVPEDFRKANFEFFNTRLFPDADY